MRENVIKTALAVAVGGVSAYFGVLVIPVAILIGVMVIDYVSGMAKAWILRTISSRIGIVGVIKKVGYLLVVCVAGVVDWLVCEGLSSVGISLDISYCFGLIVTIWLIINELISILENLATIGVPMPKVLTQIIGKLKIVVENNSEDN